GKVAYFMGIEKARFRRTVAPGDQIVVKVEMLRHRRNACKVRAVAKVDESVAAEAEMFFSLVDADKANP
ncbi:MAG: 3-hydroxyacyl-[acyl-carrier-protein] dehydratase FabZ, partial [Candidatus Hydrogenedentota bacterium]